MDDKTVMSIKIDKKLKERAQKLAKELGVPLTTVINAQLAQFVRDEEFTASAKPRMTPYLESLLEEVENDIHENKNVVGPFHSADDLFKRVRADIESDES